MFAEFGRSVCLDDARRPPCRRDDDLATMTAPTQPAAAK
jgi:hypothetical protein